MLRSAALLALMAFAAGCSASSSDATSDEEGALAQGAENAPVVLVATDDTVRARCAPELAATYCSAASAQNAKARCEARLSADERADCAGATCVTQFSPVRGEACREGATYDVPVACRQPAYDSCAFYRSCLEPARPCGEDGYALSFGERFCNVFLQQKDTFTAKGQAWLHEVRHCLQTELVHDLDNPPTCQALSDEAYLSHSRCYTAPGNSICEQSPRDIAALLKLVEFQPGQHLFKQITAIVKACTVSVLTSRTHG